MKVHTIGKITQHKIPIHLKDKFSRINFIWGLSPFIHVSFTAYVGNTFLISINRPINHVRFVVLLSFLRFAKGAMTI